MKFKITLNESSINMSVIDKIKVDDVLQFKDGEEWVVTSLKAGLQRGRSNYRAIMGVPYNKRAKDRNTSLAIEFSKEYLLKELVAIKERNSGKMKFKITLNESSINKGWCVVDSKGNFVNGPYVSKDAAIAVADKSQKEVVKFGDCDEKTGKYVESSLKKESKSSVHSVDHKVPGFI